MTVATGSRCLLIMSSDAGAVTPEVEAAIRSKFAGHTQVEFEPGEKLEAQLSAAESVIVAGGDGTIGFVARALGGSAIPLGIIPVGTYNNFAAALDLPTGPLEAIRVITEGTPRPITLGSAGDHLFLETASIGLFGEAIELGESLKDRLAGRIAAKARAVAAAQPFDYALSGDLRGDGRARSLVFTNTPTTGAEIPVGETTPEERSLELSVHVGASRTDLVGRLLASMLTDRHRDRDAMHFRFGSVTVTTSRPMRVHADNTAVGETPVTISARPGALRVLLP